MTEAGAYVVEETSSEQAEIKPQLQPKPLTGNQRVQVVRPMDIHQSKSVLFQAMLKRDKPDLFIVGEFDPTCDYAIAIVKNGNRVTDTILLKSSKPRAAGALAKTIADKGPEFFRQNPGEWEVLTPSNQYYEGGTGVILARANPRDGTYQNVYLLWS